MGTLPAATSQRFRLMAEYFLGCPPGPAPPDTAHPPPDTPMPRHPVLPHRPGSGGGLSPSCTGTLTFPQQGRPGSQTQRLFPLLPARPLGALSRAPDKSTKASATPYCLQQEGPGSRGLSGPGSSCWRKARIKESAARQAPGCQGSVTPGPRDLEQSDLRMNIGECMHTLLHTLLYICFSTHGPPPPRCLLGPKFPLMQGHAEHTVVSPSPSCSHPGPCLGDKHGWLGHTNALQLQTTLQ